MTSTLAPAVDRSHRLTGARRKVVLTVHVVAAVALLGASIVLLVTGLYAATRDDPQEAHAIYSLLRLLTFSIDVPLAFIALTGGVLLALTSKWGIFRYWWVTTKLAILLTTIVLGATLIGPSISTMLDVTETSNPGDSSVRWRLVAVASVQVTLLLGAATLGVSNPGGASNGRASLGDRLSIDSTQTTSCSTSHDSTPEALLAALELGRPRISTHPGDSTSSWGTHHRRRPPRRPRLPRAAVAWLPDAHRQTDDRRPNPVSGATRRSLSWPANTCSVGARFWGQVRGFPGRLKGPQGKDATSG